MEVRGADVEEGGGEGMEVEWRWGKMKVFPPDPSDPQGHQVKYIS